MKLSTFVKKWGNYNWRVDDYRETPIRENSSGQGQFFRDYRSVLKEFAKEHRWDEVTLKPNWYCASGFVRKGDKWVYFDISDLRYFDNEWRYNILIRTAKDNQDYHGGRNQYTTLKDFASNVDLLFEGRSSRGVYDPWGDGARHFYPGN